jgi:hypothetical protein
VLTASSNSKGDNAYRKNLIERVCEDCGCEFSARPDRTGMFCSKGCATAYRNRLTGFGIPMQELHRRYYRLKFYGLSHDDFIALWNKQSGRCAICEVEMCSTGRSRNSCHVDHDHKTGKVRGLLCLSCNHGIGKFKDDVELLAKAIVYLKQKEK